MTATDTLTRTRRITKVSRGLPTSDGAGVKLTRMLGHRGLMDLDPFLMLDQIRTDDSADYMAGFPNHPHRGFETVTIMLEGRMRHGDNKGHSGVIEGGGIQWMTAGRGIVHSEQPIEDEGRLWGFQLWVNLPGALKMTDPGYQEFDRTQIPVETRTGASLRVLAGSTSTGVTGPARSVAIQPTLIDIVLEPGATLEESIDPGHTAFIAVYKGMVSTGEGRVEDPDLGVLEDGDRIELKAGPQGASLLLVAGKPINEPVARYGPFVMNTEAELHQAVTDFQAGKF
ncbi:pirin family protein [Maricaulis maris]|uniref:Pirin domain protein n=1 Tax=Maricaulis maris (strain MCS10) TaxID=394221 RepID=Q0ASK1_MARMM|nr:pirin family protein [Maricaulis maris]ABI64736.1 Pirin domain protein [Maricaulis maris MCS10]